MNDRPINGSRTPSRIHITTHAHALTFARCLSDDFEQAHVAALTDPSGAVLEGATLTDDYHQIEHAVGFALCICTILGPDAVGAVTLFSVLNERVSHLSQVHAHTYRRTLELFKGWIDVQDWIVTDGVHYRSLAYSLDPSNAWSADPVRSREAVLDSEDPGYW